MQKVKLFLSTFFSKKRNIAFVAIVLIVIFLVARNSKTAQDAIATDVISSGTLDKTVLATGQVTSITNLNLSFEGTGTVKSVNVKVGDQVKKGQVLATIDQASEQAEYTSAQGALLSAQAAYRKATSALESARSNLEKTKTQQDLLVKNAYSKLLSGSLEAVPQDESSDVGSVPTISGLYTGNKEGDYIVEMYPSAAQLGYSFRVHGLEEGMTGSVSQVSSYPLGTKGLYIKWPTDFLGGQTWIVSIPNKRSADYVNNLNAYNDAVATRDTQVSLAEKALAEKEAEFANGSSPESAALYADVVSAQGKVEAARAKIEDKIIRAPIEGTISSVDIKLGELAQSHVEAVVLQDVSNLYIEGKVNEENVRYLKAGQKTQATFDAFPDTYKVSGVVSEVDLSSTKEGDVVNYKVKATIDDPTDIKAGMTATMTILVDSRADVVKVPSRALNKDEGGTYVYFITDLDSKKYEKRYITTGIEGDGAMTEVLSGLNKGDSVVTGGVSQ